MKEAEDILRLKAEVGRLKKIGLIRC